jgi:hypothetical protein
MWKVLGRVLRAVGTGLTYTGMAFGAPIGWVPQDQTAEPDPVEDPPADRARPLTPAEEEAWAALVSRLRQDRLNPS